MSAEVLTKRERLLAALLAERFDGAAIEAERHEVVLPAEVRIALPVGPEPVDSLPTIRQRQLDLLAVPETDVVETIHAVDVARRAALVAEANRRAAAISDLRAQRAERRSA